MTSDDPTKAIRSSWAIARQDRDGFSREFYDRLFAAAPETQSLFGDDMAAQGAKLMATLDFVVDHLDDGAALLPAARDLALRHVAYGVRAEDYAPVGAALVATLRARIADMPAATEAAWTDAYAGLAQHMIASAYQGAA